MSTEIVVQDLPSNGANGLQDLTFTPADDTGMFFTNDGNVLLIMEVIAGAPRTTDIEGVPSSDSGRDETISVVTAIDMLSMAGPFKLRNFNNGNIVDLTIATATNLSLAAVRFGSG